MSDNSGDGHPAGPGPHRTAHPSKSAGGGAPWGLGVMPGPGPEVWEQPRAGRSLAKLASGRDSKAPGGMVWGASLQRQSEERAEHRPWDGQLSCKVLGEGGLRWG